MSTILPQKRFYVYALVDDTGSPFYIGKGTRDRMLHHRGEAKRGHNCHKCNKIRKMWQEGRDYHAIKVFHTDDEKLALDKECELIAEIGSFRLCNLTGGGEGKTIPQHVIQERVIRITQNMRDMEVKKQSIQALNHFRMKKELAIIDARLKEERKARRLAAKTRP